MSKVGFTGTREGMTNRQLIEVFKELITAFDGPASEFHFGDCLGADYQAAYLAKVVGYHLYSHPPNNLSERERELLWQQI